MGKSLQDLLDAAGGDPLAHLRSHKYDHNGPKEVFPPYVVPQIPVEFSTWEREALASRETVALYDQTHHMDGLYISGPDAVEFLSGLACNKLEHSKPGRAHQMVTVGESGHLIGEDILFHIAPNELYLCGVPFCLNWVHYNATKSDLDIEVTPEAPRSPIYANGHGSTRTSCRYQIQGPNAWKLIEKLNGGAVADLKFFHLTEISIAGHKIKALRHGMAGAPGLEIWAPYELRDELRETIIEAGQEFGITLVGAYAYLIGGTESAYLPTVVPPFFSRDEFADYRKWLSADTLEGQTRLAGSYDMKSVEDYFMTPYEFGYSHIVDLDHDFIGRDALAALQSDTPPKQKVTILWNPQDAAGLLTSMLDPVGPRYKPFPLPTTDKNDLLYDKVTVNDEVVGTAHITSYSTHERGMLTVALVDSGIELGQEAVLHWGEAGGGYDNKVVPASPIREIRGTVSPAPFVREAREEYRAESSRTEAAGASGRGERKA